jgi:uncharacterized protein GlcG (DUF336 family)
MRDIDLETARAIIRAARVEARRLDLAPLAMVVLDAGGHLLAAEREDRSPNKLAEVAYGKADSAISVGRGTRGLMAMASDHAAFVVGAGLAMGSPTLAMPGGVLIIGDGGRRIGAVGVSGDSADHDEAVAMAGIASVGLVAQPD